MVAGPSVLAWVVPLERAFLRAVTLEHGRVQIQGVAFAAYRQPFHHPFRKRVEEPVHVAHLEPRNRLQMVSSVGKRWMRRRACKVRSPRTRPAWAKRLSPASTAIKNAVRVMVGSIWFGEVNRNGMCSRTLR